MKSIKIINLISSFIPVFWLITVFSILIKGALIIGHFPKYSMEIDNLGKEIDPSYLKIGTIFEAYLSIFSFLSFLIWIISTLIIYFFYKNNKLYKVSFYLFIIGFIAFLIFRYGFSSYFLWVVD